MSLLAFMALTGHVFVTQLITDDILEDKEGSTCETCGDGGYELHEPNDREAIWRCDDWDCQNRLPVHKVHPIFSCGHGALSLKKQTAVLLCAWANIDLTKC